MFGKLLKAIGVAFGIAAPVIFAYYFNRSVPDVRYTLSDKIPLTFADPTQTTPETVQQLEVKNVGNAEANRIIVKINGNITAHSVNPYSSADKFEIFDKQKSIEFVYPQLPPQAGFSIVFKASGAGINYSDLNISHSTGSAREALSKTGTNASFVLWGMLAFYLLLSAQGLRSSGISLWKSSTQYKSPTQIVQLAQPWYIFDNEWPKIRFELTKEKLSDTNILTREINKVPSYQFLTIDKPDHIHSSEWQELIDIATSSLRKIYSTEINGAFSASRILDILNTDKPQSFPQTEWEKLEEKANQHYVDLKKRDYYTQESILKALKETKPQRISQETWLNLIEHLQKLYFLDITKEMQFRSVLNPLDFANKLDLSVLGDTYRERLEQEISKLSRTKAVEAENNKMTQLFDLLLSQKALGEEKPAEIEDFRWTHLKCLETQLNRLHQVDELAEKNQREAQAIADEKPQVLARREKIERQLSFINELLDDPTRANRVEEYDDTFAPGNLANLKKVAHLLVKADTHND